MDSYAFDDIVKEGSFVLQDGTSGRYTANSLTLVIGGEETTYPMRMDHGNFSRLHQSLQDGKSVSEALTEVFRGYL